MGEDSFPNKWVPIDEEERQRKLRVFHEADSAEVDMVRSIPSGIRLNKEILNWAEKIYKLALRPDDVFVVTYPKCGTTWMMVCTGWSKIIPSCLKFPPFYYPPT